MLLLIGLARFLQPDCFCLAYHCFLYVSSYVAKYINRLLGPDKKFIPEYNCRYYRVSKILINLYSLIEQSLMSVTALLKSITNPGQLNHAPLVS